MSLSVGTRLGPYDFVTPLDAGVLGEVYRARDLKLGRDVALTVLLDGCTHDRERPARSRRAAQVLAARNRGVA